MAAAFPAHTCSPKSTPHGPKGVKVLGELSLSCLSQMQKLLWGRTTEGNGESSFERRGVTKAYK